MLFIAIAPNNERLPKRESRSKVGHLGFAIVVVR